MGGCSHPIDVPEFAVVTTCLGLSKTFEQLSL